jgi:hypothetical protein
MSRLSFFESLVSTEAPGQEPFSRFGCSSTSATITDPRFAVRGDAMKASRNGGGGSRSATIREFSNDFENAIGSIGEKRQKASVQVQNKYGRSARVRSIPGTHPHLHAFEKKTQKTSARDLQIGRDRFRALTNSDQQHGKKKRR